MKTNLYSVILFLFLTHAWGAEIRGKLSFDDGSVATGEVSIGVIRYSQTPYISALMDALVTQKGVRTDNAGNFVVTDVQEGVSIMVMADVDGQNSPAQTAQMTLSSSQVRTGLNFSFAKVVQSTPNLSGKVTINSSGPLADIAGTIWLISSDDNGRATMAFFGVVGGGAYEFVNVPPGAYTLTAGVPVAPKFRPARRFAIIRNWAAPHRAPLLPRR